MERSSGRGEAANRGRGRGGAVLAHDPSLPTSAPRHGPLEDGSTTPERRGLGDTKARLLDAAERLFAERGFEGASMRAVTRAAGTSVSAANYHFGSKEALLRATLQRRVEPMNRSRLERLDALERAAGGAPLALEALLDAYLRPLFEARAQRADARSDVRLVAARLYSDPPELVSALKQELFGEAAARFLAALERVLPGRSRAELALRFQFAVGSMVHVMSGNLESAPGVPAGEVFTDAAVLGQMVVFLAAGLRATAPPEAR